MKFEQKKDLRSLKKLIVSVNKCIPTWNTKWFYSSFDVI